LTAGHAAFEDMPPAKWRSPREGSGVLQDADGRCAAKRSRDLAHSVGFRI